MEREFVLAHLTDLHLGPLRRIPLALVNPKRVLGSLNWAKSRHRVHRPEIAEQAVMAVQRLGADHIAISGDLCNLGLPSEHEGALSALRRWGPEDRISVVPGNHDIYSRIGGDPGTRRWATYMASCARGLALGGAADQFPYVRVFGEGDGALALIGVNSAVETPPFNATGRIGTAQTAAVAGALQRSAEAGLRRVVMLHHPPLVALGEKRKQLVDAPEFEAMLRQAGADLVIYGHNHKVALRQLSWGAGEMLVAGLASGSAAVAYHDEPTARFALYRFRPDGGLGVEIHGYDPGDGVFRPLAGEEQISGRG